eukprot:2125026-Rhodomonas_salina.3
MFVGTSRKTSCVAARERTVPVTDVTWIGSAEVCALSRLPAVGLVRTREMRPGLLASAELACAPLSKLTLTEPAQPAGRSNAASHASSNAMESPHTESSPHRLLLVNADTFQHFPQATLCWNPRHSGKAGSAQMLLVAGFALSGFSEVQEGARLEQDPNTSPESALWNSSLESVTCVTAWPCRTSPVETNASLAAPNV